MAFGSILNFHFDLNIVCTQKQKFKSLSTIIKIFTQKLNELWREGNFIERILLVKGIDLKNVFHLAINRKKKKI